MTGNELIESKGNALAALQLTTDLGNLIKPLVKDIFLLDTYIAGTTHLDDPSIVDQLKSGDRLTLRRENNRFDALAILVLNDRQQKLGYIPEKDNRIFARLMDAGKLLTAKVVEMEIYKGFTKVEIGVYMEEV